MKKIGKYLLVSLCISSVLAVTAIFAEGLQSSSNYDEDLGLWGNFYKSFVDFWSDEAATEDDEVQDTTKSMNGDEQIEEAETPLSSGNLTQAGSTISFIMVGVMIILLLVVVVTLIRQQKKLKSHLRGKQ